MDYFLPLHTATHWLTVGKKRSQRRPNAKREPHICADDVEEYSHSSNNTYIFTKVPNKHASIILSALI